MKTAPRFLAPARRWLALAATPLLLTVALALTGCATKNQVARIVAQSNAAMLAGQFDLPTATGNGTQPVWQVESDRIEAFIASHAGPQQTNTTAPLRLRQAMLLLSHGQTGLAQAAFNQIGPRHLHTPRDQALQRSQRTLLWWFANSTAAAWTETDWTECNKALDQLQDEQTRLADSPEIRDYLAEMRAWVGIAAAKKPLGPAKVRQYLSDALNVYAGIFTPADLQIIAAGTEQQLPGPEALTVDVRRRLRAKAVLDQARSINAMLKLNGEAAAPAAAPAFNRWVQP